MRIDTPSDTKTVTRGALGDRMKRYENVFRQKLVPRMPAIVQVDGKAFHSFTRDLYKPFDEDFCA